MEKKKTTLRGEISWKITMLKVRLWNLDMNVRGAIRRFLHCRKNHHYMMPRSLRVEKSMRTKKGMRCVLDIEWLECRDCGWLFFATKRDKIKYLNYHSKENKNMKKLISMMGKKK